MLNEPSRAVKSSRETIVYAEGRPLAVGCHLGGCVDRQLVVQQRKIAFDADDEAGADGLRAKAGLGVKVPCTSGIR